MSFFRWNFLEIYRGNLVKMAGTKTRFKLSSNESCSIYPLTQFKRAFFSRKLNECPGSDEINFIVMRSCHSELCDRLKSLFAFRKGNIANKVKLVVQYLYFIVSPKQLRALCAIAYRKKHTILNPIQPTLQFDSLKIKFLKNKEENNFA